MRPRWLPILLLVSALPARADTYAFESTTEIKAPAGALYPALSPDGQRVAFAAPASKGGYDLYIGTLDGAPRRVLSGLASGPDTWANALLASPWSADGSLLALLTVEDADKDGKRGRDEALIVQVLDVASGKLTRVSSPGTTGMNPAFAPAGKRLCYTESGQPGKDPTLVICRKTLTAAPRVLARFERSFVYWLLPSPDGKHLALRRVAAADPRPRLVVLDASSGKPVLDIPGRSPSSGSVPPRWRRDSHALYFADLDEGDRPDVMRVALPSGTVESLGVGGCASFLAGPGRNDLLVASPRRTLPELGRTLDLSSYDISKRSKRRIQPNLHGISRVGQWLAAVETDSHRVLVGRLVPRGEQVGPDPGAAEALLAESVRRTADRILEAASRFAVYRLEHGSYPKGKDPVATLLRELGQDKLPGDVRGRPFQVQVMPEGDRFLLVSQTIGESYVEYASPEVGVPVVRSNLLR